MAPRWRLLRHGAAAGSWNMAVDETLLESAARGGPPVLRLYRWRGPWLSLGYAQRLAPRRLEACAAAGVGVVRRATGGRAVLHGADLTYAIAAPETALPPGLQASYALVCDVLRAALERLGVSAEAGVTAVGPGASRAAGAFDCFAEPAADEICAGGRKLAGSAQRRCAGAVLQHGSLRVEPDAPAAREAAGLDAGVATSLRELGCTAAPEDVERALVACFEQALGVRLEPGALAPGEAARAAELAADRVIPTANASLARTAESQEPRAATDN